ncbi:rhomboid family intramembrane serine protease [Teredinibacter haidensis]|uniref:rhomboid family intramembrane serine protease n=1 Tax=Teredinibacter haidensis TaxID=2731755 RepID=UPI0009491AEB|nr:rhomboid family intramembrane serine protease [Teredinibacter haidensis]
MQTLPVPQPDSLRRHPLVWLVIIVSCVPYLLLTAQNLAAISSWFLPLTGRELLNNVAFWQLWTPTFVHYTLVHLLTNVYLWWLFASRIEAESRIELALVFLLIAASSNACQWWFYGPQFGGLSGVVYGLLSYCWLQAALGRRAAYRIDGTFTLVLLALIPLAATGMFGKFSDAAHISGLFSGAVLAGFVLLFRKYKKLNKENRIC